MGKIQDNKETIKAERKVGRLSVFSHEVKDKQNKRLSKTYYVYDHDAKIEEADRSVKLRKEKKQ